MLVRALEGVLGLCGELATAASRWRPRGGSGRVAREVEGQREAKKRWRRLWATRGRQRDGKRRPGSLSTAPASVPSVGGGAEQSREVEMEIRVVLQFLKIPGTKL